MSRRRRQPYWRPSRSATATSTPRSLTAPRSRSAQPSPKPFGSRDDLFITTKLWSSFCDPSQVVPACKMCLQNLGMDYVDMYLIHWPMRLTEMVWKNPVPAEMVKRMDVKGVWEGMEECKSLGLAKAIGASNFSCQKLQQLLQTAKVPPALNQVEMNPVWQQKKLREFCNGKGIHTTAYSPLGANNTEWGDNRIVENDVLTDITKARGKNRCTGGIEMGI